MNNSSEVDKRECSILQPLNTNKFVLLSILTFGLYEIWWIYKSWRYFNERQNLGINSAIRTVFSGIYLIPLMNRIKRNSKDLNINVGYSSIFLFTGYLIFEIIGAVSDEFWLVSVFSFLFLLKPYATLQKSLIKDSEENIRTKNRFNTRQKFLIVIGIICWVFFILVFINGNQATEYVTYTI
jgi:hypothetical protein